MQVVECLTNTIASVFVYSGANNYAKTINNITVGNRASIYCVYFSTSCERWVKPLRSHFLALFAKIVRVQTSKILVVRCGNL